MKTRFSSRADIWGIRALLFLPCVLVLLGFVQRAVAVLPPNGDAPVDPPPYGFAIDGDLMANTPAVNVGDWITDTNIAPGTGGSVLTLAGLPINSNRTFHLRDPYNGNDNIFKGGMKWRDNPNLWQWTTGKPSSKTDINNALLHLTSDTNGHIWVVVAADRYSTAGSSYIDFEFLQSSLTLNTNNFTFSSGVTNNGGRTVGDLLFSLAFVGGGSTPDFLPYRWQTNGAGGFDYVDATAMLPAGRFFMGVNTNIISVPYGAFNKTSYDPNAFAEAAIDLTALLGNFDQCASFGFKTILVKTKSSTSDTSSIEDFITPFQYTLRIGPDAQAGPDQVRCTEGAETVFPLTGTAGSGLSSVVSTTWSVLSGNAIIDDTNSLVTTAHVSSTSATLRLTVVQANGCTQTDAIVLSVQQPPVCSITGVTSTCPRTTNTFSAPVGMTAYAWSVSGGGLISGPANQQTVKVVATAICGTNYTLSLNLISNVCSAFCAQDVAVIDTGAPVLTCPTNRVLDCPAVTTTNVTGVATATDSCSRATVTYADEVATGCGATKVIARTWTAADECGNSVSCVQTITVRDITPPVITCPQAVAVSCASAVPAPNTSSVTTSDGCGGPVNVTFVSDSISSSNCANRFVITRTYQATDECGNSATCTQTITVNDITVPSITCPAALTVSCASAVPAPNIGSVTTSDGCGGTVNVTFVGDSISASNCANRFVITRTYRATDACGNSATCTQTITVNDTTPPVITCAGDKTVECTVPWTFDAPTATDTCGTNNIVIASTTTNKTCGNTFTAVRTWRATDACGNQATCSQTVTVVDTTAPTITCVGNKTIQCSTPWTFDAPAASDTCGTNSIAIVVTTTNAGCGNTLTATRTWRATDACGNQATCSQTVIVIDTNAPIITCPAAITIECPTAPTTNVTGVATATDTCGTPVVTFSDSPASTCGNARVISRTWRATDPCGNSSTCVQTITIRDTTPPVLTIPTNAIVECGSSVAPNATGTGTATDACNSVTVTFTDSVSNFCGNARTIFRRWLAMDSCNNSNVAVQTITVRDTTPPALSLPANRVLDCPANTATNNTGVATATDVCGGVVITYSEVVSNSCGVTKTIWRTWTATDQCGNSTNGVQTIVVRDTPPTISCPTVRVQCVDDLPLAYANLTEFRSAGGVAADACDTNLAFALISDSGLVGRCPGTVTRVYRVTDDCGLTAQCTQTITVDDTIAPTLTCLPNVTVECGTSLDTNTIGSVTATDNCSTNVVITRTDSIVNSTYDFNWYASDTDVGTGPYSPTFLQLSPGSLPCPSGGRAIDPLRNAVCFAPNGQLDALTSMGSTPLAAGQIVPFQLVIDAGGGPGTEKGMIEVTANWSSYTTSNDRFGYDTNYMVYCAFVDAGDPGSVDPHYNAKVDSFTSRLINNGTSSEQIEGTFHISGLDSGDRVIVEVWMVLQSTVAGHVGGTISSGLVSARKLSTPPEEISLSTKTIPIGNLNKFEPLPPPQPQPPAPPIPPQPPVPPGRTTSVIDRTWAATDDCGNRSTCVQRITVRDTLAPTFIVPANLTLQCPADISTNNTGTATALDACGAVIVTYSDTVTNLCGVTKTIARLWTATDDSGNTTNVVQTIAVNDANPPTITCSADRTVTAGQSWDFDQPTASDNCGGGATVQTVSTVTNVTGPSSAVITRIWRAVDACGNSNTCQQTITVVAPPPPVITLQPQGQTVLLGSPVTLNVAATGAGPLTYQWQMNGANVPGATGSSCVIPTAQFSNGGLYRALVSNPGGTVASSVAVLNVSAALSSQFSGGAYTFTWAAPYVLQSAPTVIGPYTDVPGATSPYSYPATGPQRYFRLRPPTFQLVSGKLVNGKFTFGGAGVAGCNFVMQASTNLVNWVNMETNPSPFLCVDSAAWQYPCRFYRVVPAN